MRSKPLVWENDTSWEGIAISAAGTVFRLSPADKSPTVVGALNEPVRANLVDVSSESGREFVASTESGLIVRCRFTNGNFSSRILSRVRYQRHSSSPDGRATETNGAVYAAPAREDRHLFVTFARDAYYPDPPLTCIDSITGETVWRSKARTPTEHFGNCRVTPMIVDSYVIAAFAYSDSLHIFDKMTGDNVATVKIGPQVFQQWSAPTLFGAHHVLLAELMESFQ